MFGRCIVPGSTSGEVLYTDIGLSFMGGVDPKSGEIIDTHHPLRGRSVKGKILAMPSGRGSCAGSLAIFELLMNGHAPSALIFQYPETILTLGVIIAKELFDRGIPVICLTNEDFHAIEHVRFARIDNAEITAYEQASEPVADTCSLPLLNLADFYLDDSDHERLAGLHGEANRIAMQIILRTAQLEGVRDFINVEAAHIDGCFYHGPGTLLFAKRLLELGALVRVPSTMNAIRVDRRKWRTVGVSADIGNASDGLADTYQAMGVRPTYTCAPYLLENAPILGQQIAWAESNAVVYANSVLGARTMKYPDYLDILVAITGRAPNADCHSTGKRHATVCINVPPPTAPDDAYFAALGYLAGSISPNNIPVICGLEKVNVTHDDLKGFGAAFATTSAAAMFHIVGVTPEAPDFASATGGRSNLRVHDITTNDLAITWSEFQTARDSSVDLISLGNPHFSLGECQKLASLCADKRKAKGVRLVITCGREVFEKAKSEGYVKSIMNFGGEFLNDTCWCLIGEPVISPDVKNIMTNSGKYAHYGPAAVGKGFHFASLETCVTAAIDGRVLSDTPAWLSN